MRTCSIPSARKSGHSRSTNIGAVSSSPTEVRGATALLANPTATCPMNMRPPAVSAQHARRARAPDAQVEHAAGGEAGDDVVHDHAQPARQALGLAGAERLPDVEDAEQ